jgi:hypothetical protein
MKRIAFFAAMALSCAAYAQDQKPAAPKPEPIKAEPLKPAAKPAAMAKKTPSSKRGEDARQCLEQPTNDAIIKCAEEFL